MIKRVARIVKWALLAVAAWTLYFVKERRLRLDWLLAAVAPGMCWQSLVAVLGARLQGYDFMSGPSFERLMCFFEQFVRCIVHGADGSWVALCATLMVLGVGRIRTGLLNLASWIVVVAVGGILVACSESSHFAWMLEMSLGRYMWLASAIPVCEACLSRSEPEEV